MTSERRSPMAAKKSKPGAKKTKQAAAPRSLVSTDAYASCSPTSFSFSSTAEAPELTEVIAQDRAVSAVRFGVEIDSVGYNIYALGPTGTGKASTISQFLDTQAAEKPTPPDWVYVTNFNLPHRPKAICLPAGRGNDLKKDMGKLIEDLQAEITQAFESEEYEKKRRDIAQQVSDQQEEKLNSLRGKADEQNFTMVRTPAGLAFAPKTEDGETMPREQYSELSEDEQKNIDDTISSLNEELQQVMTKVRQEERAGRENLRDLDGEVTTYAAKHLVDELKAKWDDAPEIPTHLDSVLSDVVENADDFKRSDEDQPQSIMGIAIPTRQRSEATFRRYQVNVIVDRSEIEGAPVVEESNPTLQNLVGRIERQAQFGALVTDFNMIKADFDTTAERNPENEQLYAHFVGQVCRQMESPHFTPDGVARIVEHGSRLIADQKKLSIRFLDVVDLIREAAFYAARRTREAEDTLVCATDVQEAIDQQIYRSNRTEERLQEMIVDGTIMVDTEGEATGQINGLVVVSVGDYSFGRPTRITSTTRLGDGEVIDIEREVEMGGPIHSKGVLILSGYLGAKYASEAPLSLSARLVFEQSYSGVEGDSASSAELYSILSSLSKLPLRQDLAVTGSVNQHGQVQPIGGVNEKIEGFFAVCNARGLKGTEGVLIPQTNVRNLMLSQNVREAIAARDFHIYPVSAVDEGISILTGVEAGEPGARGAYPKGTVNRLVAERLGELSKKRRETAARDSADEG